MGNKASKPARKLTNTIVKASDIGKGSPSRIQLPSQELKDRFQNSTVQSVANQNPQNTDDQAPKTEKSVESQKPHGQVSNTQNPEGKDGMDPQADQDFIKFINNLGRQIHSHSDAKGEPANVMALKQLLNRKKLYEKGQDEVKAQLETTSMSRSMIHPRTLTAIVYALNDPRVSRDEIVKDYQISADFLQNMSRFKVAENVVIIEDDTKPDEIGPKSGQPVARASSDPSLMDENGTVSESVNDDRMRELRSRLE